MASALKYPVITPICKNYKKVLDIYQTSISGHNVFKQGDGTRVSPKDEPCSKRDYEEQNLRAKSGLSIMWDDAKGNPTKKAGGLFAFIHNGVYAQIHIITKVCKTTDRLVTWSRNVGHSDRNVLILSPKLMDIDWDIWSNVLQITPKMERGTRIVKTKAEILNQYVKTRLDYVFEEETGEIIVYKP